MNIHVRKLDGGISREITLPAVFSEEYRPDLIKKAVISLQSRRRQPHGTYVYAGLNTSATGWGSGRGASHVPRIKTGSRAARVPQAKGGRQAHPPVVQKILIREINKKEARKALRSALAASASDALVRGRGHLFTGALPIVLEDQFESLDKTTDVIKALSAVGIYDDVIRAKQSRKVRAGRGKLRGRRYKQRKSILIVTGGEPLRAAKNLPGVDVATVASLNTELLAPGTHAGRLTVFTEGAIARLGGE